MKLIIVVLLLFCLGIVNCKDNQELTYPGIPDWLLALRPQLPAKLPTLNLGSQASNIIPDDRNPIAEPPQNEYPLIIEKNSARRTCIYFARCEYQYWNHCRDSWLKCQPNG